MSSARVVIVGAAGAVGQQLLKVLADRSFPLSELRLAATARSAGQSVSFGGESLKVQEISKEVLRGADFAFIAASTEASREWAPIARDLGVTVIDKSNAFRMDPKVPLVVPEVNPQALRDADGIIASPNCSTIQLVVALWPLEQAAGLHRVVVSTYQAVSGTGREAMDELTNASAAVLSNEPFAPSIYPRPIAFNVLPQCDSFDEEGYTLEERKLERETRRILGRPDLKIAATAVRVPVQIGHSESVNVEFQRSLPLAEAMKALQQAPGLIVATRAEDYPTPLECAGRDEVFVGRLRADPTVAHGLAFFVVSDNLRKGAATNAVQIAETLLKG